MTPLPPNSPEEIARLRELPYRLYLDSMWWQRRRYAKLQTVGSKCRRCAAVTTIVNVHHITYERLGAERDSDLEVLCHDCHEKHHAEESAKQNLAKYAMLAFETVRLDQPTTYSDMRYAFEARCRDLHLPIDKRIERAIPIAFRPKPPVPRVEFRQMRDTPPFGREEAIKFLRSINAYPPPIRSMPDVGKPIAPAPKQSTEPIDIECPRCGPGRGRRSWVVTNWVLCLTCRQWNMPPSREVRLTRETEETANTIEFPSKAIHG
jgi:hypothetical protein